MKALVVEDDTFYLRRICEKLADFGIEAVPAGSLEEAMRQLATDFSVVITDIMLPNDPQKSGVSEAETRGGSLSGLCFARFVRKQNPECKIIFLTGAESSALVNEWAEKNGATFIAKENGYGQLTAMLRAISPEKLRTSISTFIVHGHDEVALLELKNFLQNSIGLPEPIVLREKPNAGRVILEKFDEYASGADLVFVLLTPDDIGRKANSDDDRRRGRQNVIFELGFFFGKLGRNTGKVIVLAKGGIELPSDIHGLIWINIEHGINAAGEEIRRELRSLGY
jgi:predicted nucleotide-binding protein